MEQGSYLAVSTGEHLLVPDLGLVLKSTEIKGIWINGPFRANQEEGAKGKETKLKAGDESLDALRKEVNARLQYVLEVIKSPRAKLEYLCDLYNEVRKMERLAAIENPARYARIKLEQGAITAVSAGEYIIIYPCLQVKEWKWRTLAKTDKCYEGLAIEFKLSEESSWIQGFLDSRTNEVRLEETPVECSKKKAAATLLGGRLEYHPVKGEPRAMNVTGATALDGSVSGVPMIDLLNTDWVYNPEELGSDDLDRQEEEEETRTEEPHLAWRVLGITSIAWEEVVDALWEWFTRAVCLWLVVKTCWKVPMRRLIRKLGRREFPKEDRNDSPVGMSGTKRGAENSESTEEIGPKVRKLKGGEKSRGGNIPG